MDENKKKDLFEKVTAQAVREKHFISIFCKSRDVETLVNMPGIIRPFIKIARTVLEEEKQRI